MAWFAKSDEVSNGADDFDRMIRALATARLPEGVALEEAPGDALVIGPITTTLTNLRRAWVEQDPADRIPWLERTVSAFVAHEPPPAQIDFGKVRPAVRSRTSLGLTSLQLALEKGGLAAGSHVPSKPIAADLAWTLMWDSPAVMDAITDDQLHEWGCNFDDLLAIAKTNLAMQPFLGWTVVDDRMWAPLGVDDYDGTRIFLPGALEFLPFDGERVVFHPTRSSCAVVSADDPEAILAAAKHTLTQVDAANRISLSPVVGTTDNWRPLELDPDHLAYIEWKRLVTYDRASGYDIQHRLLDEALDGSVFIAKYAVIEDANGALGSYCTWSRDVETLLPIADRVAFYEAGSAPFLVPWDAAVEVCGHLIEPTVHYPERVRVREFPSPTELSILRSAAY